MIDSIKSIVVITVFISIVHLTKSFICPTNKPIFDSDISYFHLCLWKGSQSKRIQCPEGSGFLNNDRNTGCVPFTQWQCTHKEGQYPPDCNKPENLEILLPHVNPNYYWTCADSATAILLKCPKGTGFTRGGDFYGCVEWSEWLCKDRKKYYEE